MLYSTRDHTRVGWYLKGYWLKEQNVLSQQENLRDLFENQGQLLYLPIGKPTHSFHPQYFPSEEWFMVWHHWDGPHLLNKPRFPSTSVSIFDMSMAITPC